MRGGTNTGGKPTYPKASESEKRAKPMFQGDRTTSILKRFQRCRPVSDFLATCATTVTPYTKMAFAHTSHRTLSWDGCPRFSNLGSRLLRRPRTNNSPGGNTNRQPTSEKTWATRPGSHHESWASLHSILTRTDRVTRVSWRSGTEKMVSAGQTSSREQGGTRGRDAEALRIALAHAQQEGGLPIRGRQTRC